MSAVRESLVAGVADESPAATAPSAASSARARSRGISPRLLGLALLALALAVYLPVGGLGYVALDDAEYVADNPYVKAGLSTEGLQWAFTTGHAANWHPITWISHQLDATLFGPAAAGPHLVNAWLHALNGMLLFFALRRLTGALWRPAVVAALFVAHPLRIESVAWIAERKDVLSGSFFLLTLWAYARYVLALRSSGLAAFAGRWRWYGLALLSFALGLMSKPMLVTLPCVLVLLDVWPLQRFGDPRRIAERWPALVIEKIPFAVLSVGASVATFLAQQQGGAVRSLGSFSLSDRVANALVANMRYLADTFWPAKLAIFYPHPGHWPWGAVAAALAAAAALIVVSAWFWRRQPGVAVGFAWWVGMLVPTLGFVQVGNQSHADRYTYLPSIGLLTAVVFGAAELARRNRRAQTFAMGAAVAGLVGVVAASSWQLRFWRSNEALFGRVLAVTERNFVAHHSLGTVKRENGQLAAAADEFRAALAVQPRFAEAEDDLGSTLFQLGRSEEALAHFSRAVALQPGLVGARYNRGVALAALSRPEEALREFEAVIERQPTHAEARLAAGNVRFGRGEVAAAIRDYEQAVAIEARNADAWNNLGQARAAGGQTAEAIAAFEAALRLNPDHANARHGLALALLATGATDRSIEAARRAVALQPRTPDFRANFGAVLATAGRTAEAVAQFRVAVRLAPGLASAQHNLGCLLLEQHDPESLVHLRAAQQLAPDNAGTQAALAEAERLFAVAPLGGAPK